MRAASPFFILTAFLAFAVSAPAQDSSAAATADGDAKQDGTIWAGLFFATDSETGDDVNEQATNEYKAIFERLTKAFKTSSFQLLGEHTQAIFSEYESWVVPSKDLFLKIDSKGPSEDGKGIKLHLQMWRDKNVLVKTDVVLRDTPIFIRGPKWGDGHLIMAVEQR